MLIVILSEAKACPELAEGDLLFRRLRTYQLQAMVPHLHGALFATLRWDSIELDKWAFPPGAPPFPRSLREGGDFNASIRGHCPE
jgi:hypothetical protein